MKDKNEVKETQAKLTNTEIEDLTWASDQIQNLIELGEVSEDGLKRLQNAIRNLNSIQEVYILRLFRILKMGYLLD